jgi:hypothetical protein
MTTTFGRNEKLLRHTLRGNGIFTILSAVAAIAAARPLADFIGLQGPIPLIIMGGVLLAHGAILWWGSSQAAIPRWLAWYAIAGDAGWIAATIVLLVADPWNFSTRGRWLLALSGDMVAVFAILQYIGLRRLNHVR